jgi:hypothetical protein
VVIIQHAAQTLSPLDRARVSHMARLWSDQLVGQALGVSLGGAGMGHRCEGSVRTDSPPWYGEDLSELVQKD